MSRSSRTWRIAALLFGSGFCALVYQVCWLREFRLVFGASTAASAAVLAIFAGGLGAGALVLGPHVDTRRYPLSFYAVNTLGAVIGTVVSTFILLERLGTRNTLWLAAACNAFVAILAAVSDRFTDEGSRNDARQADATHVKVTALNPAAATIVPLDN